MGTAPTEAGTDLQQRIAPVLERYWGFSELRPLQAEAITAGLDGRDSLIVMPTGSGKSLCYQVPPAVSDRLDVVVSPLIALMKDQVDGLRQAGYPAAAIHSQLSHAEREQIRAEVRAGQLRLLFITPERLLTPRFLDFVDRQGIRHFAIDEAHCISQWGHDFRKEYRGLSQLKQRFPDAAVHAFTATATERVQQDIVEQLGLRDPARLIGTFDRPNLVYRVIPSMDVHRQVLEIVRRHGREAVIVYCLSRRDTEELAAFLCLNDVRAAAYHAGLERDERRHTQEAFAAEEIDVVVATVAFGMGIDRSNVRCVIHAAMPKTVENYQQETGRAGRDGLEAECVLLYTGSDVARWQGLIRKSAQEADDPQTVASAQLELLEHMQRFCRTLECRHRALSRYFGQPYPHENCGACDICLGEVEGMEDSTTVAQKILSCVYRTGQRYGVAYVAEVLRGAETAPVRERGHDKISTHGLLRDFAEKAIVNIIYQLIDQGYLERTGDDRPVVKLTEDSMAILRGEREVLLVEPETGPVHKTDLARASWEGVDEALFEKLRDLRREMARERSVPAYVIFGDAVLRDLARRRPSSRASMAKITGIGNKKLEELGPTFIEAIRDHCEQDDVPMDVTVIRRLPREARRRPNPQRDRAMVMFDEGAPIEQITAETGRAESTIVKYLTEYIEEKNPERIGAWVPRDVYDRVAETAGRLGADRLAPVREALGEEVSYNHIRLVLSHMAALAHAEDE